MIIQQLDSNTKGRWVGSGYTKDVLCCVFAITKNTSIITCCKRMWIGTPHGLLTNVASFVKQLSYFDQCVIIAKWPVEHQRIVGVLYLTGMDVRYV